MLSPANLGPTSYRMLSPFDLELAWSRWPNAEDVLRLARDITGGRVTRWATAAEVAFLDSLPWTSDLRWDDGRGNRWTLALMPGGGAAMACGPGPVHYPFTAAPA
jgi:hypothetical protein